MIVFRKARNPQQTLNDLDAYISGLGYEPVRWLAREVQSWGEFSYDDIAAVIESGRLDELIDWQERWAGVVNRCLAPMWLAAIEAASRKATRGLTVLSDSNDYVKAWVNSHGGELITVLSDESRKAVSNILLRGQGLRMAPRDIAREIRPLIGLTDRQAQANLKYKDSVYNQTGNEKLAEKAALKYAGKQHRYRAETIILTENAFAYNRGAHMGVSQSIAAGLMGRCEMVWTTAGTNRVCSRCMELKDRVVGYTDEVGVTLPPLHPRCRCAIVYREVGAPRVMQPKPSQSEPRGVHSIQPADLLTATRMLSSPISIKELGAKHYEAIQEILVSAPNSEAVSVWRKFEKRLKIAATEAMKMENKDEYLLLNLERLEAGEATSKPYQKLFHEGAHAIDFLNGVGGKYFSEIYKNGAFLKAINADLENLIEAKHAELQAVLDKKASALDWDWLIRNRYASIADRRKGKISFRLKVQTNTVYDKLKEEWERVYAKLDRANFSDILDGYTTGRLNLGAKHEANYWSQGGKSVRSGEAFAEFFDSAIANQAAYAILKTHLPTAEKIFSEMLSELLK